jgi:hypothetical protein
MVRLTTEDGYSLVSTLDQKILVLKDKRFVWTPVEQAYGAYAIACIGVGDIGKSSRNEEIALRAGLLDCTNPIISVWEGDQSMREAWIRGVVEGFGFLDDQFRLPYSDNLQILLLSIGIPST